MGPNVARVRGLSPRPHGDVSPWWPRATCPHTYPLPQLPGGPLPTRTQCCSSVQGCAQNQGKATDTCSGTLLGTWGTRLVSTERARWELLATSCPVQGKG